MANEESKSEGGDEKQAKPQQKEEQQPPSEEDNLPPLKEEYQPSTHEGYPSQQYHPQQAGYPQQYQPPYQYGQPRQPYPKSEFQIQSLFTKPMLVLAICIGVLIIWIGSLIITFTSSSEVVDIGIFLQSTGALFLFGGSLFGAVACKDFDKWSRLGLLVVAAASLFIMTTTGVQIYY